MNEEIPGDLKFLKSHEWARIEEDGLITVGISEHAQEQLGDLVYVELPAPGDAVPGVTLGAPIWEDDRQPCNIRGTVPFGPHRP